MSPAGQTKTSAHVVHAGHARGAGGHRKYSRKGVVVTQELVEEERARLIEEKQREVQRVLDKHDDLVRFSMHSRCRVLIIF